MAQPVSLCGVRAPGRVHPEGCHIESRLLSVFAGESQGFHGEFPRSRVFERVEEDVAGGVEALGQVGESFHAFGGLDGAENLG